MNRKTVARLCRPFVVGLAVIALFGCSALRPTATAPPAFYSLGSATAVPMPPPAQAPVKITGPTLIINPPRAAAGFDSPRIIYVHEPHKLDHFAHSVWVDSPARMLGPLLVTAMAHTGAFGAVVLTPGAAAGDLRLDTEIIRLQHDFQTQPSRVRFTLRAVLVEDRSRRVLATREFDGVAVAPSEDPYGGVLAANEVVQTVLENLAAFCAEAVRSGRMASPATPN